MHSTYKTVFTFLKYLFDTAANICENIEIWYILHVRISMHISIVQCTHYVC